MRAHAPRPFADDSPGRRPGVRTRAQLVREPDGPAERELAAVQRDWGVLRWACVFFLLGWVGILAFDCISVCLCFLNGSQVEGTFGVAWMR